MAKLVITPADVKPASTGIGSLNLFQVGEAVDAGEPAYLNTTSSKYGLAEADNTDEHADPAIIALTSAGVDGYVVGALENSEIDLGVVLVQGESYILGADGGGIYPISDFATGWRKSIIGYAKTTSIFVFKKQITKVVKL